MENQAIYQRVSRSLDEGDKIEVHLPLDHFYRDTKDFKMTTIDNFLKSGAFAKDYKLDGKLIKT